MATEASNVEVEDTTNNNNDASSAVDSSKMKDENQEIPAVDVKIDAGVKVEQSSQSNNNNENAKDSTIKEGITSEHGHEVDQDGERDDDYNADDDNEEGDDIDDKGETEGGNDESMDEGEKTNLIVNYLPQDMTDEAFRDLFTKFGEMKSCKIVRNRITGYSYGFGFVDFESHEQAIKAIEELNGHELDTKKIKVAFARPAGQDIKQANLYVKNIPVSWTADDVRKAFEAYGNIIQVRVLGGDRGIGFVLYDLRKQAEMALESMQGKTLDGADKPLEIKFAADKKTEGKRSNRRGRSGGNNSGNNGRTRERGNRGGANRNNRNRSHSDSRHRSQPRGNRSHSDQRGGGNRQNNNYNPNSSNNNGFGPIRQPQGNRIHRYAPFAPVQQQQPPPLPPQQQAAPMAAYGYPSQQQYMHPYMLQQQQAMLQMNPAAAAQPMAPAAMAPMGAYQMPQMTPISYGTPAAPAATAQTMTNMYNMASSTMQNAAQMQPQLGQPMNQVRTGAGGGGGQSTGGGGANNDGVTLFVYNIGPQSDETELRTMFAPYGQVLRCNVVRKTPGGETKGFGFVTLKDRNQANAAIASLNGSPRNGKTLQVSFKK